MINAVDYLVAENTRFPVLYVCVSYPCSTDRPGSYILLNVGSLDRSRDDILRLGGH